MTGTRPRIVTLAALIVCLACADEHAPGDDVGTPVDAATALARRPFVGTWSLVEREPVNDAGEALSATSDGELLGSLIYDASGFMSMTTLRGDPTPPGAGGPTAEEAVARLGSAPSFFGRYTIDETAGVVTHHVEGSRDPGDVGSRVERLFTFEGDRLRLRPASGDDEVIATTWVKRPPLAETDLTPIHRQLVGAYRLDEVTRHTTDGYALPVEPYEAGHLVYTPSGDMALHLVRPDRPAFAGGEPTPDEAVRAVETYDSVFGPFSVYELAGCITCPGPRDQGYLVHHGVGSGAAVDAGTDARRYFELSETELTLRPPVQVDEEGRSVVTAIRWERVSGP